MQIPMKFVPLRDRLYRTALRRAVAGCDTILDVGCGTASPLATAGVTGRVFGMDVAPAALAAAKRLGYHAGLVRADATTVGRIVRPRSVDAVVALDMIEHLDRPAALALVVDFERIARRRVVLLTPNGFVPQPAEPDNPYQEHRSGFTPADLRRLGYRLHGVFGLKWLLGPYAECRIPPRFFWRRVSDLSAPFTAPLPALAFALLATKEVG
jgi:SAM-dependent methyltransferase